MSHILKLNKKENIEKAMKAKEVLKLLRITRVTLSSYVRKGIIEVIKLPNGRYDYVEQSVYKLFNGNIKRKTVIYSRVSTTKQKKDLENQIELLKNYCFQNGYQINGVYSDVASGINFDSRKQFFEMLDQIFERKINKVVISYKDRLSRVGYSLFVNLFKKFGCQIQVVSQIGSTKLDSEQIFEQIVSLLHCYSMKLYSKRKDNKIKELLTNE